MKALSDTLEAMKLDAVSPKGPPHGLTMTAGQLIIAQRDQPLTESNLMQIVSKMLLEWPEMQLTKKKIYGRRTLIDDAGGKYEVDNEPVGEEDSVTLQISFRKEMPREIVEAAMRPSPPQANLGHLTRLAIHKRLGTNDNDRAILLNDYTQALRMYPDFVVYMACRCLWESSDSPFYPKIKLINTLCETIYQSIKSLLQGIGDQKLIGPPVKIDKYNKDQYFTGPKDNPLRRELCDFIVSKGGDDLYEMTMLYSNYILEMKASRMGWKKSDVA